MDFENSCCYLCGNICVCNNVCVIAKCTFNVDEIKRIANSKCNVIQLKYISQEIIDALSIILEKTKIKEIWLNENYYKENIDLLNAIPNGFNKMQLIYSEFIIKNYPNTLKEIYIENCNYDCDYEILKYLPQSVEKLSVQISDKKLSFEHVPSGVKTLVLYTSDNISKIDIDFNTLAQSIENLNIHFSQSPDTYSMIKKINIKCDIDLPNIKSLKICGNTSQKFAFDTLYNLISHCINCTTFTLWTEKYMDLMDNHKEPFLNNFDLSILEHVSSIKTVYLIIDTDYDDVNDYFWQFKRDYSFDLSVNIFNSSKMEDIRNYRELTNDNEYV